MESNKEIFARRFATFERINLVHIVEMIAIDDGKTGLILELLQICEDSWPGRSERIARGLSTQDFEMIDQEIHTYKTTCYNAGATRAAEICLTMQTAIEEGTATTSSLRDLFNFLDVEVEEAMKEGRAYVQRWSMDPVGYAA